jgi:hypothetical protein
MRSSPLRPDHRQRHQLEAVGPGEVAEAQPVGRQQRRHRMKGRWRGAGFGTVRHPRDLAVAGLALEHAVAVVVADDEVGAAGAGEIGVIERDRLVQRVDRPLLPPRILVPDHLAQGQTGGDQVRAAVAVDVHRVQQ